MSDPTHPQGSQSASPAGGSGSGSGSGSSSGGSGETARPNATQQPPESITFTFSSRNSPFVNLSPPGSVTFVSKKRRENDASRDRSHRASSRHPPPPQSYGPGWITLAPLKPVADISPPLFPAAPKQRTDTTKAVFSSASSTRQTPRLSLVAQHHHATSPHPFFDAPPHLITPPTPDPFSELTHNRSDGYFPLMPTGRPTSPSPMGSRRKPSKPTRSTSVKLEQPQPKRPSPHTPASSSHTRAPSRALTIKPSKSQSNPRAPPNGSSGSIPGAKQPLSLTLSSPTTPRRLHSRKSTPPQGKNPSPDPQPSIAAFRDCFGVLTRVENVFPSRTRSRSRSKSGSRRGSRGSENVGGSGGGLSESQRRWTKRWLRRTLRGVGSMGSGSTSSGSLGSMGGPHGRKSDGGRAGSRGGSMGSGGASWSSGRRSLVGKLAYLGMTSADGGSGGGDGSQDSLDRVRVSRSNAPSPTSSIAATVGTGASEIGDVSGAEMPKVRDFEKEDSKDSEAERNLNENEAPAIRTAA